MNNQICNQNFKEEIKCHFNRPNKTKELKDKEYSSSQMIKNTKDFYNIRKKLNKKC